MHHTIQMHMVIQLQLILLSCSVWNNQTVINSLILSFILLFLFFLNTTIHTGNLIVSVLLQFCIHFYSVLYFCRQSYARWIVWAWWWICHTFRRAPCVTLWKLARHLWYFLTHLPMSCAIRAVMYRMTCYNRWPRTVALLWLIFIRDFYRVVKIQPYMMQWVSNENENENRENH